MTDLEKYPIKTFYYKTPKSLNENTWNHWGANFKHELSQTIILEHDYPFLTYFNYKNREIDATKPVQIYKNLHKPGFYSIRQNGLVVAHSKNFTVRVTNFHVNENGRQKVIREKKKFVHAWCEGYIIDGGICQLGTKLEEIYYNPYTTNCFVYKDSNKGVIVDKNMFLEFGEKVNRITNG